MRTSISKWRMAIMIALVSLVSASLLSLLIIQRSRAAFSSSTQNSSNSWATGSVTLTDNDSGSAMFSVSGLHALDSEVKCIQVTYSGSFTSFIDIKLYGSASGSLAEYLDFKVEIGTGGGAFSSCSGFSASSTLFNGNLNSFATSHMDYTYGLAVWSPSATPQTKTFRITTTVQDTNSAQNKSANATLTWQAQERGVNNPVAP